jgi:HAD superfamily hydrolase (TIGR01509 family)
MLKALFFDLDGTLANTDPIHFLTWQELLRNYGLEIDENFYKTRISGRLNPIIVKDILPNLSPQEGEKVADAKEAHFRKLATDLQPLPGLSEILEWSEQSQLKRALVTNAPRDNVFFMMDTLNLQATFDLKVLAEDTPAGKPDPAPYQVALEKLNLEPKEVIAFEDSPSGIRSAVAAGIRTIGITSTQTPATLNDAGADFSVPNFADAQLWEILNKS